MKVEMLDAAYSLHGWLGVLKARSRSQPRRVRPIACINIVVDCILVEPASAMYPTLQLILLIFGLWMNSFDLSTFCTRISSVLPYNM